MAHDAAIDIGMRARAEVVWLLASVLVGGAHAAAGAEEPVAASEPVATPYRPSVSTPAALSAPGWLEVEAGFLHEHAADARRDSVPYTLKLAFSPDWGVRVGADAWARHTDGSGRTSGIGDTGVVVKRRFAVDDQQAFGLEAGAIFATARHGVGSGSGGTDVGVNGLYSADLGAWHADLNIGATRLGRIDDGASRLSLLGALAVSHPIGERWGAVAELSGTHQRGGEHSGQLLVAASYNLTKRLVLDAGATRSLRSGAPVWSALAGFTWTAARLF